MALKILVTVFVLASCLAGYIAFKTPKSIKILRSLLVQAPAETLFPYINNPRFIQSWNPFSEGDATLTIEFSGPTEGVGAKWVWQGKKAGAGEATLIESERNKRVAVLLDFKKPFKATSYGEYSLVSQGPNTEVSWMIVESALIPRVLSNFINLDKVVGAQFEKGLSRLKGLVAAGN